MLERERLKKLAEEQRKRHTPIEIPPCRVCGKELSIQALGGGRPTIWGCSGFDKDMNFLHGRSMADKHYSDSTFEDRRHTDSDALTLASTILALLSELEQAERERPTVVQLDTAVRNLAEDIGKNFVLAKGDMFREQVEWIHTHIKELTDLASLPSRSNKALFLTIKDLTKQLEASEAALRTLRQASRAALDKYKPCYEICNHEACPPMRELFHVLATEGVK